MRRPPTRGVAAIDVLPRPPPCGHPRRIDGLADTARFRTDDSDQLVIASLACPVCLRTGVVDWELDTDDGYDPSVRCGCRRCEECWRVYLTPQQALRLGLMFVRAA